MQGSTKFALLGLIALVFVGAVVFFLNKNFFTPTQLLITKNESFLEWEQEPAEFLISPNEVLSVFFPVTWKYQKNFVDQEIPEFLSRYTDSQNESSIVSVYVFDLSNLDQVEKIFLSTQKEQVVEREPLLISGYSGVQLTLANGGKVALIAFSDYSVVLTSSPSVGVFAEILKRINLSVLDESMLTPESLTEPQ